MKNNSNLTFEIATDTRNPSVRVEAIDVDGPDGQVSIMEFYGHGFAEDLAREYCDWKNNQ